jgi:hypothetical protein
VLYQDPVVAVPFAPAIVMRDGPDSFIGIGLTIWMTIRLTLTLGTFAASTPRPDRAAGPADRRRRGARMTGRGNFRYGSKRESGCFGHMSGS